MPNEPRFDEAVRDLADRHHVTVTHVVLDPKLGDRAHATARHGDRVSYGPALEAEGPEFTRWAAAHETAHIALGHCGALANWGERGALLGGFAVGLPLLGVGAVRLIRHEAHGQMLVLLGWTVMVVLGLVLVARLPARGRAKERAADDLAARWGYPFTEHVTAIIRRQEGRLEGRTPTWLRDHPQPSDRVTRGQRP